MPYETLFCDGRRIVVIIVYTMMCVLPTYFVGAVISALSRMVPSLGFTVYDS